MPQKKNGNKSRWRANHAAIEVNTSSDESMDKVKEIQLAIEDSKNQVNQAITKTIARGDQLADLENKADNLQDEASIFNRSARSVRRRMCWQNAKANLIIIFIVLIVALIVYFAFIHPLVKK
eukprot:65791_1